VKILTFNVWQLPVVSLVGPGRRRARLAVELIRRVAPDVVVLNEAFHLSPADGLVAGLRAAGYQATGQVGRPGGSWTGVSGRRGTVGRLVGGGIHVLSRLPIGERHQHVYRAGHAGTTDTLANKGVALVSVGGAWLAATHLQASGRGTASAVRMAQLAELRALVDRVVPADEPVLIAGDLNIPYRAESERAAADRVLGGRIEPDGPIHANTFDGATNPLVRKGARQYRDVLDYIGQLRGPAWRITTETLDYPRGAEVSDHYPVLGTVTRFGH
jgi:endonuclease/exonuclease/phosphatase family metal-dependent hydrolase